MEWRPVEEVEVYVEPIVAPPTPPTPPSPVEWTKYLIPIAVFIPLIFSFIPKKPSRPPK